MDTKHCEEVLLRHGIRVFEYRPGFLHAKLLAADGVLAICGSVNLDFRSLWEHYEGGVLFTGGQVVEDIETTILDIQKDSRELHYEEWRRRSLFKKIVEQVLCLLAPLM